MTMRHVVKLLPLLIPGLLWANEQVGEKPTPPTQEDFLSKSLRAAENTRDVLSNQVVRMSDYVDSFVGDERAVDEINDSHLQLRQSHVFYEDGSHDQYYTTRFKLDLPRTNRKLSLVIESENDQNQINDSENTTAPATTAPTTQAQGSSVTPSVQYVVRDNKQWHIRAHLGMQFDNGDPDPTTKLRIRRLFRGDIWNFRITETLFWYESVGEGETTQFDLERALNPQFFFRATNKSTWHKETENFDLLQQFTLFQDLGSRRLLSYYAAAFGVTEPEKQVTAYALGMNFRQLIHKDWLYMDIAPLALYPVETNFRCTPSITVSLEILIGNTGSKPGSDSKN